MNHRITRWATLALMICTSIAMAQDAPAPDGEAEAVDYKKLKNPQPYTKESIKRGRLWFMRECTGCHGTDGKAQIDIIADATDLTNTKRWFSGSSDGEIYRSIRDGAGVAMPPYKAKIKKEDDLWHLVNFVRSLWPKDQRPELVEPKPEDADDSAAEKENQ
jgi:mono/diheme cytochrome c family protein